MDEAAVKALEDEADVIEEEAGQLQDVLTEIKEAEAREDGERLLFECSHTWTRW